MHKKFLAVGVTGLLACYGATANALLISIDEFTGDNAQMLVEILNAAPSGITAEWSFSGSSANTGDITGVWLGIADSLFNPSAVSASDVSVLTLLPTGVTYTVAIGSAASLQNLGGGVNLNGESGFALLFDFDLALAQVDLHQQRHHLEFEDRH